MQIGMIGLGRMGANMVARLAKSGNECVVFDVNDRAVKAVHGPGIVSATSIEDLVGKLRSPAVIWLMIPAGTVDNSLTALGPLLSPGDIVIDGGNSYYRDDIRRGIELSKKKIHYVDVGTSGGIAGLDRGFCLMIGGEPEIVEYLNPIFSALAPGAGTVSTTTGLRLSDSTAEQGYLHCGPQGAGHFVKMIHNGIEYGIMGAYAEGLNILRSANVGKQIGDIDAETTPLRDPEFYQYDLSLPEITELWRRGSVIGSWLLDLTASALASDPDLEKYAGHVADSGEGRWTILAAIDEGIPTPILSAALFQRFSSRGNSSFSNKLLSAMRQGFGGHVEKNVEKSPE